MAVGSELLFRNDRGRGCRYVCGADGAGRAAWAGPLVTAAVRFDYTRLYPKCAADPPQEWDCHRDPTRLLPVWRTHPAFSAARRRHMELERAHNEARMRANAKPRHFETRSKRVSLKLAIMRMNVYATIAWQRARSSTAGSARPCSTRSSSARPPNSAASTPPRRPATSSAPSSSPGYARVRRRRACPTPRARGAPTKRAKPTTP